MRLKLKTTTAKAKAFLYFYIMSNKEKIETNPFKHGNVDEVWKTLLKNSRRLTRGEANKKIEEALSKKKKSRS